MELFKEEEKKRKIRRRSFARRLSLLSSVSSMILDIPDDESSVSRENEDNPCVQPAPPLSSQGAFGWASDANIEDAEKASEAGFLLFLSCVTSPVLCLPVHHLANETCRPLFDCCLRQALPASSSQRCGEEGGLSALDECADEENDDGGNNSDEDGGDCTSLLTLSTSSSSGSRQASQSSVSNPQQPALGRTEPAVGISATDVASSEPSSQQSRFVRPAIVAQYMHSGWQRRPERANRLRGEEQPPSTAVAISSDQCEGLQRAGQQCAAWVVMSGSMLFFCGYLVPIGGARFYLLRCLAWVCLSSGLVAFSCYSYPVERSGNGIDTWMLANPQTKTCIGVVLTLQSLISAITAPPHLNLTDALVAAWVTCHGCIRRNVSVVKQPAASTLLSYWFPLYHWAAACHFIEEAGGGGWDDLFGARSFNSISHDSRVVLIRGLLIGALTLLRFVWLTNQWFQFRSTNGAAGTSPGRIGHAPVRTLLVICSAYSFVATEGLSNASVSLYLQYLEADWRSVWMLCLAACQGAPLLGVAFVGRARLHTFLTEKKGWLHRHFMNLEMPQPTDESTTICGVRTSTNHWEADEGISVVELTINHAENSDDVGLPARHI